MPVGRWNMMPGGLVLATLAAALAVASQSSLFRAHAVPPHIESVRDGPDAASRLLGFTGEPVDAADVRALAGHGVAHGAVVTSVAAGSAADHAGLEIGDVVVSIDGQRADTALDTLRHSPRTLAILHRGVARTLVLQ